MITLGLWTETVKDIRWSPRRERSRFVVFIATSGMFDVGSGCGTVTFLPVYFVTDPFKRRSIFLSCTCPNNNFYSSVFDSSGKVYASFQLDEKPDPSR